MAPSGDSLRSQSPGYSENYQKLTYDLIRLFEPPSPPRGRLGKQIATPVCGLVRNDMQNTIILRTSEN